ncbi:MAG: NUDIX domain-containing protein [Gemmatimonadales bacterium]|nr:MAG: NUDIX domain-containing protein [Gemmatimonadales bacterium]
MNRDPATERVVPVVAAVVRSGDRFLLALRPEAKRHGGLWEFPGGKVASGETEPEALARELQEELGLSEVRTGRHLCSVRDPGSVFEIRFWEVEVQGEVVALEHEALRFCRLDEALEMPLAPADRQFLESEASEALTEETGSA